jgi:adenylate cyclase
VAKTKAKFDWRLLLFLPIPLLWALVSEQGHLRFLDDKLLDYRFRYRGEITAPVSVVYVDMDSQSLEELGNFPWPRSYFAQVGAALTQVGKAKAIGVDVVFSEVGVTESYDRPRWIAANLELARYLRSDPAMVVAASYAAHEYRGDTGKQEHR